MQSQSTVEGAQPAPQPLPKLIFGHALEGLLRTLGPERSAQDAQVLRQLGLDPEALEVTYPLETQVALVDYLAQSRWGHLPREEAYAAVGRAAVLAYESTLLGRVLLQMLRVLGPERMLYRLTKTLRSINNYTETQVRELGPGHFEVWLNVSPRPHFTRGMLEQGLIGAGARNVRGGLMAGSDGGAVFYLRWDANVAASLPSA